MLSKKRTIDELVTDWQYDEEIKQNIAHWHTLDGKRSTICNFSRKSSSFYTKSIKRYEELSNYIRINDKHLIMRQMENLLLQLRQPLQESLFVIIYPYYKRF